MGNLVNCLWNISRLFITSASEFTIISATKGEGHSITLMVLWCHPGASARWLLPSAWVDSESPFQHNQKDINLGSEDLQSLCSILTKIDSISDLYKTSWALLNIAAPSKTFRKAELFKILENWVDLHSCN